MSYINAIRTGESIKVWERHGDTRTVEHYPCPHYFYIEDPEGDHTSMFGEKASRIDFDTSQQMRSAKNEYEGKGIRTFESDIPPELKILSSIYYDKPAPKLFVSFLDIEVDYDKELGFSSVANPYAPINSIALYHTHRKEYVVLAVPPNLAPNKPNNEEWEAGNAPQEFVDKMEKIAPYMDDIKIKITFFENERALLIALLQDIEESDLLCGWNSEMFDIPYIGKRLEKMGKKYFNQLSFGANSQYSENLPMEETREPKWRTVTLFGVEQEVLDPIGRICADYMLLFKKYEMAERPSYKLESISDEMLPNLPKLEYSGTLADLYRDDFAYFVRYNIRDTEILHGLEDNLGYVETANQMMHLSTGLFKHVGGTLKLAELATINYCHHKLDLIVRDNDIPEEDGQIQGAFVLLPQIGLHKNISSVDLASLYPMSIRSMNISQETIIGQFVALQYEKVTDDILAQIEQTGADVNEAIRSKKSKHVYAADLIAENSDVEIQLRLENGDELIAPAKDFRKLCLKQKWAVSGYGTVFDQNKEGIIPMILSDWYAQRKKYKKLMAEAKDAGDTIKATYYDKLQYVYKIKLNSFYGALTNKYFRFYDLRMGESTTGTGRQVLLHQCAQVCKILDGEYKLPNKTIYQTKVEKGVRKHRWNYGYTDDWSVVYGDTDSTYFVTHAETNDEATLIGDRTATLVNESFQAFMEDRFLCNEGFSNLMECEREVVSDRGIFVDKKRYILHLVDLDGWKCDKIKVMGLDTKKTTLPKEIADSINAFVERYLKGEEWEQIEQDIVDYKDELRSTDQLMSIGLPKGIKGIEAYTEKYEKQGLMPTPGHVRAALFYNICKEQFDDKESMRIVSGMKIKVFYLAQPVGKFITVALPVDIEKVPEWMSNFPIDYDAHITRLVDNPLDNIIKAIGRTTPTKQSLAVNDLLGF